jgi:hypothetical protein
MVSLSTNLLAQSNPNFMRPNARKALCEGEGFPRFISAIGYRQKRVWVEAHRLKAVGRKSTADHRKPRLDLERETQHC